MSARQKRSSDRGWYWAALLLGTVALAIGCNPGTLSYFLMPWVDDKVPPRVKLAGDKEVTVVVTSSFAYLDTRAEHQMFDQELSERLTAAMSKRFAANKEKVKIVPTAKVRSYVNSRSIDGNLVDKHDLGKHFKADYVIALEISPGLSLYEYKSPQLYRGSGEI